MTVRKYDDWARIIEHKIDAILTDLRDHNGGVRPPVDLESMRGSFKIIAIEERPMVPEAATEATRGGFKIYLQSNFAGLPGTSSRFRFTLAHEFCHTFFYDLSADVPRRIHRAPVGEAVEALCHRGAGLLLVPTPLLKSEIESLGGQVTKNDVLDLAKRFQVSVEVILRRLQEEVRSCAIDRATILVGRLRDVTSRHILGAYYGPWILPYFQVPKYGIGFDKWLNGAADIQEVLSGKGFRMQVAGGTIVGSSPCHISQDKFFMDRSFHVLEQDGATGGLGLKAQTGSG